MNDTYLVDLLYWGLVGIPEKYLFGTFIFGLRPTGGCNEDLRW